MKKKINDYILNNYTKLFFTNDKNDGVVSAESILTNEELIIKVEAELRLCEDRKKAPRQLLQECINELEEKGFFEQETGENGLCYTVRDQRAKLRHFITTELKKSQSGSTFDSIHARVSASFQNFYTKDFVFTIIDELF